MKKTLITCLLMTATSVSLLAEDFRGYRYEVTPYIGMNFADNRALIKDSSAIGVNFSTYFTENIGLRFTYERFISADVKIIKAQTDVNRFFLNGMYKMSNEYFYFTPYIFLGGGYEAFEDKVISGGQWLGNVGAGLNYAFNERIDIGPEIRVIRKSYSDNNMDVVALLGVSYRFGLDALPPPPEIKTVEKIIEKIVTKEVPVEKIVEKIVYRDANVSIDNKGEKVAIGNSPGNVAAKDTSIDTDTAIKEAGHASHVCPAPTPSNYNDRCDNSYYIQVSAALICKGCDDKFKNDELIKKLNDAKYKYELYSSIKKSGKRVDRLLVGPFKCKKDAFVTLCEIKVKKIAQDAFIFSKKSYKK